MSSFLVVALCFFPACASKDKPKPTTAKIPANIGIRGIDAGWSNYGAYIQKLVDTVQIYWDGLNEENKVPPPSGTKVAVKFRLNSEGQTEIISTDGNGAAQIANLCESAITGRAPYGKWTEDMIAVLGDSQEMTFTFYYGPQSKMNTVSGNGASSAPSAAGIYDLRDLDQIPQPKGIRAAPVYPTEMKRQGISGTVVLVFIVDTKGDVRDVRIVKSTNDKFNQSAIDAVSQWKFHPGKKGGRLVNVRMQIPISFNLADMKR